MPTRRKTQKKTRRYSRRYKKAGRRTTTVNRALQPFAPRYICKMKYSDSVQITSASTWAQMIFRLNSVYDPNLTNVGHQAYGFDQLSSMYNRYRVISCGYSLQAITQSGKTQILTVLPTNETMTETTADAFKEKPRCRSYVLVPGTSGVPVRSRGKIYLPSLLGRTKSQYMADDRYQSSIGLNPSENAFLYLQVNDMDGSTSPNVYVTITLEYLVEWFDPKELSQS